MKNKKSKEIIAWLILIILLITILLLSYIRFFSFYDYENVNEITNIEVSSNEAIDTALINIVDNFNDDEEIAKYTTEGLNLQAILKNHSVYIYYINEIINETTTYEFNYSNLSLNISIKNDENSLSNFNLIYKILIKAIQKRINSELDLDELINSHINENIELNGITKTINKDNNTINYKIDITKKIETKEGSE